MIDRLLKIRCVESVRKNPATVITGPRQSGKTTLARDILQNHPGAVYLDLERPSDLARLENTEWFLGNNTDKLVCIDEVQRMPELFPVLRSIIDLTERKSRYLLLGSASGNLLRQSSESLAGRVSYHHLSPFIYEEIKGFQSLETSLSRGGYPLSILAANDSDSFSWRKDILTTYLERDLKQWSSVSSLMARRLLTMLAHNNGQMVNYSSIGKSLGISNVTVKNFIDLFAATFMLEIVAPFSANLGKRLVKTPKIYIEDTGIACSLLDLENYYQCTGHPTMGALWETVVLNQLRVLCPDCMISFYRTSNGAELDFIIQKGSVMIAFECKTSLRPVLTRGNFVAFQTLKPDKLFIVAPVKESWPYSDGIDVIPLHEMKAAIDSLMRS